MHMSDALLSPAVGGICWAATATLLTISAEHAKRASASSSIAKMGIMGAFVFACQMINFTIPGTGSSGHLGGGLLLAIVLGPSAAFIAMASVLFIQALFFADGGLLAFGANVFNLGFFTCFLAYPLIFKPLAGDMQNRKRVLVACIAGAVAGLQLGALGVVLETVLSGISSLPFATFAALMQPIHLAIGLTEGAVTAGVVLFLLNSAPETLTQRLSTTKSNARPLVALGILTALLGGTMSWFASQNPDGLEWAVEKITGHEEMATRTDGAHAWFARVQEKATIMPDYTFASNATSETPPTVASKSQTWPNVNEGKSLSGILGGTLVFALIGLLALVLRNMRQRTV
jgi:cobalt/nickel transport system permease protein